MRRRRPLTARGAALIVTGVAAAIAANILAAPVLLYLAVLMLLLVGMAILIVYGPRRRGEVTRAVPADTIAVGEESSVLVRLSLRSIFRAPAGRWIDTVPPAAAGTASGPFPPDPASRTAASAPFPLTYTLRGRHRGVWHLGPLALETADPFGLVRRTQEFGETTPLVIVPAVVPLSPLPAIAGTAGGRVTATTHRLGQGADNLSPRTYLPGDSMRRIHWRATARRGTLMVRQEEQESNPDAIVVLDRSGARWPGSTGMAPPDPLFETAISACASLALRLHRDGYDVDVTDIGGGLIASLRDTEEDAPTLLRVLAEASCHLGSAAQPLSLTTAQVGPLLVVTGHVDDADAPLLRPAGAALPMLFAASASSGALAALADAGWHASVLGEDISEAWDEALPTALSARGPSNA